MPNTILVNGGNIYRSVIYSMMKNGSKIDELKSQGKNLDIKEMMDILNIQIKIEDNETILYIGDEKIDEERHTDPFTSYQEYLLYYINVARKNNATPILLSSIYRRHFDEFGIIKDNCHLNYPKAMEELAKQENVIYIDMCQLTKQMLINLGAEKSKELFMNFKPNTYKNYPEGKIDNTHLRIKGAKEICKILVNEISKIDKIKHIIKR